jgi:hypothetical protein
MLKSVSITSPETQDSLENQSKDGPATTESLLRAGEKFMILFKAEGYSTLRTGQDNSTKKMARPLLLAATDNQSPPPNHRH